MGGIFLGGEQNRKIPAECLGWGEYHCGIRFCFGQEIIDLCCRYTCLWLPCLYNLIGCYLYVLKSRYLQRLHVYHQSWFETAIGISVWFWADGSTCFPIVTCHDSSCRLSIAPRTAKEVKAWELFWINWDQSLMIAILVSFIGRLLLVLKLLYISGTCSLLFHVYMPELLSKIEENNVSPALQKDVGAPQKRYHPPCLSAGYNVEKTPDLCEEKKESWRNC